MTLDAAGIDLQVLSHVSPGVQTLDVETAIRLSLEVNDWLGDIVNKYPDRFAGFAMLPMQSPRDAADELERTVKKYGFKGALINGHTNGRYLDEEFFSPVLAKAEMLNIPIYIHPTDPPQGVAIFITTSGVFDQAAFDCARKEIGIDNLLFSVDDPFGDDFEAMEFLHATAL